MDGKSAYTELIAQAERRHIGQQKQASVKKSRNMRLSTLLVLSITIVFAVVFSLFVAFDTQVQRAETQRELLDEARMFAREMDAVWAFMDNSQYTINNTSDGVYEFKGLHCSVVGKSIGNIFSKDNDYRIRYTNFNPRNSQDTPDDFEAQALESFNADPTVTEFYTSNLASEEGNFRYVRALEVNESCLECHGEPVGELDVTEHPREGWTLESVGGAISISIPLDQRLANERSSIVRDAIAFIALITLIGLVITSIVYFFVIRPINGMKRAFADMQNGELGVSLHTRRPVREIEGLVDQFNTMSEELEGVYRSIELQVRDRTADLDKAKQLLEHQYNELARLNEKLKEESQLKTNLLSVVNHELRTPLTAIIALAQVAIEEGGTDVQAWRDVEESGVMLLDMINDMLSVAKANAGMSSVAQDVIDLGDLFESVSQTLSPLAARSGVELTTDIGADVPLVKGDFEKSSRILINLISNAIKFSESGSNVTLSAAYDANQEEVRCSVADEGIGIAEEDLERVFDLFVQADSSSTRKYPGTGLGLTIAQDCARLQGYSLVVESRIGVGSTFTLVIPKSCII